MSKFIVDSSQLHKRLSSISGVITNSPVVPVLECFLVDVTPGKLIATASDLSITLVTHVPVESNDTFSVCIPAKLLLDTVKNIPAQPITISLGESGSNVEVKTENGVYKIAIENAGDYPRVKYIDKDIAPIKVNSSWLSNAIQNTLYAVSNDDLRPAMNGISFEINDNGSTLVSTDGHRLSRYISSDVKSPVSSSVIVPKKAAILLKGILGNNEEINIKFSTSHVEFKNSNVLVSARIIDERFPDYQNAIPTSNDKIATIDKDALLSALKRVLIYSNKSTSQVRLEFNSNTLSISAEDLEYSNEAKEGVECQYSEDTFVIGFNGKLLIEALSNINSDTVNIEMSQPNRPGIIKPVYNEDVKDDILALVMPVMLNN